MNGLKFVFCEGKDDVAVINGVAQSIGITGLSIDAIGGKDNLKNVLGAFKTRPEFAQKKVASLGIVRDADDDGDAAFRSVCDWLRAHDFFPPSTNGGITDETLRVGVLIIGPEGGRGMLEDLCLQSASDSAEFACVESYFHCVAENSERKRFSSKAKVRAWMAPQADHELYVGKAAEKGYWPWENPVFDPIKQFLRVL
jgi:hypothetical protein